MKISQSPAVDRREEWLTLFLAALIPGALLLGAAGTLIYTAIPLPAETFLAEIRSIVVPQAVGYLRPEPKESGTFIGLCLLAFPAAWAAWMLAQKMPETLRRTLAAAAMILLTVGFFRSGSWLQIAAPLRNPAGWCLWGVLSAVWVWLVFVRRRLPEKILQTGLLLLLMLEVCSSRFYSAFWIGQNLGNEHISIVTYAVERAVQGVPEVHLYGFYPQFLAPLFRWTGLTLNGFSLLMAVLYLIVMVLLFESARRWIRNSVFFAGSALLLLMLMNWHDFLQRSGVIVIEPYFSYFPLRLIFPVLGLFWVQNVPRTLRTAAVSGVIAALGLWFTPDTGLALAGAFTVYYLGGAVHSDARREAWKWTGIYFVSALIMLPGTALILRAISGAWPPVWEYFCYFRDFQKIGYFMLPMEDLWGFWMVVASIYLGAMIAGIRLLRQNSRSFHGRMYFFLAVLGCGLLLYYVGRSHPFNLLTCSWPAVLLYFGFAARLCRGIRLKRLGRFWGLGLLPAILLPAAAIGSIVLRSDRIADALSQNATYLQEMSFVEELCRDMHKEIGPDRKGNVISYAQGALHLESGVPSGIAGFNLPELIFERDFQRVTDALLASDAPLILVGKHWYSDRIMPLLREKYVRVHRSHQGFLQIFMPVSGGTVTPGAMR